MSFALSAFAAAGLHGFPRRRRARYGAHGRHSKRLLADGSVYGLAILGTTSERTRTLDERRRVIDAHIAGGGRGQAAAARHRRLRP